MGTLIIGGGVAGLCVAAFSYQPAVVIEHLPRPGRKLLATGGGRCNLSLDAPPAQIARGFKDKYKFVLPALRGFSIRALRAFFQSYGVETIVEADGGVYPASMQAASVLAALVRAAEANGAQFRLGCRAEELVVGEGQSGQRRIAGVATDQGVLYPERVILATGGQSYPQLGSDGSGFALAAQAGLRVVVSVPALAALHTAESWVAELAGISCGEARMWCALAQGGQAESRGALLFTHKGLSGPAPLALAGAVNRELQQGGRGRGVGVRVELVAGYDLARWLKIFGEWRQAHGTRTMHNLLAGELPRALAVVLCERAGVAETTAARLSRSEGLELAGMLSGLRLEVVSTDGWQQAMVTSGGVAVEELEAASLRCREVENLCCVGEVVDVDAPCGGYNLTWALASGRLAGAHR